eukprot:scaffold12200_cov122-Cylindrotheca_fusiformis.AAC.6
MLPARTSRYKTVITSALNDRPVQTGCRFHQTREIPDSIPSVVKNSYWWVIFHQEQTFQLSVVYGLSTTPLHQRIINWKEV